MGNAFTTYVLQHAPTIIGAIFGVFIVMHAAQQRRPTGSTLAWLLGVILLPYLAIPLYFVFGGRKLDRAVSPMGTQPLCDDLPLERMLVASGAPPPTRRNTCELIVSGEAAFAALIQLIEQASLSIHISTLIFSSDDVGTAIADKLCDRAREGLDVRVLVDGLFEFRSKSAMIHRLRKAGAQVVWFMPVFAMPLRNHANLRLHRKIAIADNHTAIVGGMNLAREYMGPTPDNDRWRDLSAIITGAAVTDLAHIFASDWHFATHKSSTVAANTITTTADTHLQIVASGPDMPNDLLYDASLQMIFDAKLRLWLATPYFVPGEALTHAFITAIRRGVDVRIILPLRSNHRTADLAGAGFLRDVATAGGTICCYAPSMMHAKAILVDDTIAVIGSANMDMRSLFLNYELGVFIRSQAQIAEVERWFHATFPACVALPRPSRLRAFAESVARLLAPLE